MSKWRKVEVAMHWDERYQALSSPQPNGKSLWQYLLTGPRTTTFPGLVVAREEVLASDLGWTLEGLREAFREVFREGLAKADWKVGLVVLTKGLLDSSGRPRDTARPASPNVLKSWARSWAEVPECGLKAEYLQTLKAFAEGMGKPFAKAFEEAFAKALSKGRAQPSPHPSPNQEKEQEQEKETGERESRAGAITNSQPRLVPNLLPPEPPGSGPRIALVNRTWDRLNAKRRELATARGWRDVHDLHPHDPGRTELSARVLESGAGAEAAVEHVLAIAFAEAEAKGTVQWLTGAMFQSRRWSRSLGMQLADARRTKPDEEAPRPRLRMGPPVDEAPDLSVYEMHKPPPGVEP